MSQIRSPWVRLILVAVLGLVLIGTFGPKRVARAVEFDYDGVIAADEVIDDDVFISSEKVVVDGVVKGNLFVSASNAEINGTVGGDLLVTSADVTFNGQVDGNMAFAGQFLSLEGAVDGSLFALGNTAELGPSAVVGRNLFFLGFGLVTEPGSTVGRDMQATGYQALLGGRVDRDVRASLGALEIEGAIGGDVVAEVSEPEEAPQFRLPGFEVSMAPAGLRVAEEAQIDGALTYTSPVEQADAIEASPGGGVVHRLPEDPELRVDLELRARQWVLGRVQELLTLFVLGGVLIWRLPDLLDRLADQARARPLPAAGWGLLVVIGGYASAFIITGLILILGILLGVVTLGRLSFVTFGVGFSGLSLALTLFWLMVAYGSKLVVICLVGKSLLRRLAPRYADRAIWPLLLGILLYVLLRSIPLLGWLLGVIVTLIGMGAMWLLFRQRHSVPASS